MLILKSRPTCNKWSLRLATLHCIDSKYIRFDCLILPSESVKVDLTLESEGDCEGNQQTLKEYYSDLMPQYFYSIVVNEWYGRNNMSAWSDFYVSIDDVR